MRKRFIRFIAPVAALAAVSGAAYGQDEPAAVVVPTTTVEIGQTIRADQLALRPADMSGERVANVFRAISDVAGSTARRRLLPDQPVRADSIRGRLIFAMGATVLIRFARQGITIDTMGLALQNGGVGDRVRVRNVSTSVIVQGVVGVDGVVYVPHI